MKIVEPSENPRVERLASNLQHKDMLAVYKGNQWLPIAYDVLDGFLCDETLTHKAVLTDKPYIGYHFPVGKCHYLSEIYLKGHAKGKEVKALPEWFGAGFYENTYDHDVMVNSASGALGVVNKTTLNVGLDYVLAKKTLDAVD